MATDTKALAKTETYLALDVPPTEVAGMLLAASGGQRLSPFDLDVVKVPSGQGAAMWSVQTIDGEEARKAITGIAILQRSVRSYWRESLEANGGGSPPDCSSQDGEIGVGDPGPGHPQYNAEAIETRFRPDGSEWRLGHFECHVCPQAQFGSDPKNGRGQACSLNLLLFLLQADSVVPTVVKVPPSSVKVMRNFILRLAGRGIPLFAAEISLGLKKTQNAGGIAYFEIEPAFVRRLDDDEVEKMRGLRDALAPVLGTARIEAD